MKNKPKYIPKYDYRACSVKLDVKCDIEKYELQTINQEFCFNCFLIFQL